MDIKGKSVLVTGGSRGIGRAIALAMAKEGANVGISARNDAPLKAVGEEIRSLGVEVFTFAGDMSDEEQINAFVAKGVAALGGLDILVNNAGIGHFHHIADFSTKDWDELFAVNVRGPFLLTRAALPHLRKAGESVVINVASLAGKNTFAGGAGYAATKHALKAISACLMLEERDNGVRVLAICPGSVRTEFFDTMDVSETRLDSMLHPDDVADSVVGMIKLPQRAMISEIDIRPTNPRS